ncbi:hypothetical protein OJF2_25430 [Aquisphaera giovannonii]|uniref:Uncharacterized protein n=1 Tax=Aquisphaera giovannonii TaxID=406548 RepID=A0A5B9W205_9BACT|nr:hypothetical protein [Aquisphaera giovannonii]QEH34010.1 hypothetical protein OJF2_25430 [Aquisphaera giovannonii]
MRSREDRSDHEPTADALRRAFAGLLSRDVPLANVGGSAIPSVEVANVASDGSSLDLVLTFRVGERYCCSQLGCHLDLRSPEAWAKIRGRMDANGLTTVSLPTVRRVHTAVEPGALFDPGGLRSGPLSSPGQFAEDGPFFPAIGP